MHSGKTQPNWIKEDNGHNFRKSKQTELENIIHHKEDKLANGPRETSQRKQKSRNISNETWIIQTECVPLKCRWDAIGLENTIFPFPFVFQFILSSFSCSENIFWNIIWLFSHLQLSSESSSINLGKSFLEMSIVFLSLKVTLRSNWG